MSLATVLSAYKKDHTKTSIGPEQARTKSTAGMKTNSLAIWSLVLGVLSIIAFVYGGCIIGIIAVGCGHISRARFKQTPALKGSRMALAGLIAGYFGILIPIIFTQFHPAQVQSQQQQNLLVSMMPLIFLASIFYFVYQWFQKRNKLGSVHETETDASPVSGWGIALILIGVGICLYFAFGYDTSVSVDNSGTYISGLGTVGEIHTRVHNIGLMQNRQLGLISGIAFIVIGFVVSIVSKITVRT